MSLVAALLAAVSMDAFREVPPGAQVPNNMAQVHLNNVTYNVTLTEVRGRHGWDCDITADILALDHQVEERIRDAHLPLPGLAFDTEGDAVLYQGVPLSQASGAEQLRVGVSLAIAANPKLKVMLIRDGSLLDDNNLALLREMAEQSGHQIWIERVGNDGASVVLEDGEIVGGNLAVNLCPADTDVEDLN
jgi:hypothetical protein